MESLIRRTLDHCGYHEDTATDQNLINCFYDYVDSGKFGSMDLEEAIHLVESGEVTMNELCYNLLKLR